MGGPELKVNVGGPWRHRGKALQENTSSGRMPVAAPHGELWTKWRLPLRHDAIRTYHVSVVRKEGESANHHTLRPTLLRPLRDRCYEVAQRECL